MKTGGRSAAPLKDNKERSRMMEIDRKLRRTEEDIEENNTSKRCDNEQEFSKIELSLRDSKKEKEKRQ